MKRKSITRREWERIVKAKRLLINWVHPRFGGYASAIFAEKVSHPLCRRMFDRDFTLIDNGYTWIQRLPQGANWSLTACFDDKDHLVQVYFDVTAQNGLDEQGEPFYDDLYLDVVFLPEGRTQVLDEDELDEALQTGDISQAQYDLAWSVAGEIQRGIAAGPAGLISLCQEDLRFFRTML